MAYIDKRGLLETISPATPVSIELGCGPAKRDPASVGIDALDFPCVDVVGDLFEVLAAIPAATVSRCYSSHLLEHVDDLNRLVDEIERVLQPGGTMTATVPHFSNPYFFSDPTHSRAFGLYTMSYLSADRLLRRKVPLYGRTPRLELLAVHLGFTSPFPLRRVVKRLVGPLFNAGRVTQEFWEENLCYLFPCYEITYTLKRLPD
jgi:SAM-dependent methyltransferase